MHRADRITAAVLLAFAIAFAAGALEYYPYWGEGGPGSAFLPFWLGVLMAALATLMLIRRPRGAEAEWLPQGEGRARVLVVIAATVVFVAALKVIGMVVGTALYLATLMRYLERHRWALTIAVSIAAAALNYLVFAHWLRVPFPGLLGF
jgi:putative tricarboxylic transport membrane protein